MAERLESRALLSAYVGTSNGVSALVIEGTAGGDLVQFEVPQGGRLAVVMGGTTYGPFRTDRFSEIHVNLHEGTDVLQHVPVDGKPVRYDGGPGDPDRIEINTSLGDDLIEVSAGRVTVAGRIYDYVNTEDVIVHDSGGSDTLRLLSSAGAGTAGISLLGGGSNDVFDASVPWTGDLYFDGDFGDDLLIAHSQTHFDYWPGENTDRLQIRTTDATDWTTVTEHNISVYDTSGPGATEVRSVNHHGVEQIDLAAGPSGAATGAVHTVDVALRTPNMMQLDVTGSADRDLVKVNTSTFGPTAAAIAFAGNGGDDLVEMQNGAQLRGSYDGGAGNDTLVFSSTDAGNGIVADHDSVHDQVSVLNYLDVGHVEVRAEGGDDTVYVGPSVDTSFLVRGHRYHFTQADPLDHLTVTRSNGGTPTSLVYTPGSTTDGTINFADRKPIAFSGIDKLTGIEDGKPTASAGGPYEVVEGKSVQLDGTGSAGFQGSVVSYAWDFDYDGVSFQTNATGSRPTFSAAGLRHPLVRTVAVRVTDQGNRTAIGTTTVTLKPTQPPVARPGGPYEVYKNSSVLLNGTGSSDPDGTVARYEWDLNYDGVTFDVEKTVSQPSFIASGLEAGDVRTVALRVVDDSGVTSPVATTTVTVKLSAPPTARANGPYTTAERSSVLVQAGGTAGAGDVILRYEWDFDYDGVTFDVDAQQAGHPVSWSHNWDGPGTRTIAARVTTQQGQTAVAATTVNVTNVSPNASVSGGPNVNEGSPYTLTLNPGHDPGDTVTGWRVDWGDGNVEPVAGSPASVAHAYADGRAEHVIKAWAVDEDGEHAAPFPGTTGGTFDQFFGTGGKVTTHQAGTAEGVERLVRRPDGRLVAVGQNGNTNQIWLFGYRRDGSLDPTWNSTGRAGTSVGTGTFSIEGAALLPDGKLLVLGDYAGGVAFVRYTPTGQLDTTLDGDGVLTYPVSSGFAKPSDLLVLDDGRIRVAGSSTNAGSDIIAAYGFLADGSPDPSFGSNGLVKVSLGGVNWVSTGYEIAADPQGRLLVAGATSQGAVVSRLTAGGQVDGTFAAGTSGYATISRGDFTGPRAMLVQPDGKVLVAAESSEIVNNVHMRVGSIYRLNADGSPDSSFGSGNRRLLHNGSWGEFAEELALDAGGRIYAAGNSPVTVSPGVGRFQMTAFRLTPSGAFDTTFGNNGRMRANFSSSTETRSSQGYAIALEDHRVYVAGHADVGGTAGMDYALARGMTGTNGLVTVDNVAPALTVQAPAAATAGTPVQIQFAASDPGADTVSGWSVDWGDGTVEPFAGDATGASHAYEYGAARTIRVTATDEDGSYAAAPVTVTVSPPPPTVGADGVLRLWGGEGADAILTAVEEGLLKVSFNGTSYDFELAAVRAIDVRTYAGGDSVTLAAGVPSGTVHLGDLSQLDTLSVNGALGGGAEEPLAVTISGGTVTLNPGVAAALTTGTGTTTLVLRGTDAAEAWTLENNRAAGAGTTATWTGPSTSTSGGVVAVRIDAFGGDDTFDSATETTSTKTRPAYTINGGAGADVVRVNAGLYSGGGTTANHGGLAFNGGDDDDRMETAAGLRGSVSFQGDAGNDVLIVNGESTVDLINVSDTQVRRTDAPGSNNVFTVIGRVSNTVVPWEDLRVYANGGNDAFTIGPITRPLTQLEGGAGDDRFTFGADTSLSFWRAPVQTRGGEGTDTVVLNDHFSGGSQGRTYALDGTGVRRDADSRHAFESIEAATLNAPGGPDTVTVTPAEGTTFTINGGYPDGTVTPADKLVLNHAGATGATLTPGSAAGSGSYTFTNRQPVHFVGIEDAAEVTAPTADVADVADDPRSTPVDGVTVVFTEPVTGFDAADLRLARDGVDVPLTDVTVATTDNATFTVAGLSAATAPGGQYVLTVKADGSGIKDAAGNALTGDASDAWFNDAPAANDPPPTVTGVFVSGSAWAASFRQALAAAGLGDGTFGYRISPTDQLNELPWTNVNQISIRFSEPVNVAANDLIVRGVRVPTYSGTFAASPLTYDPATFTATWRLSQAIAADKVLLDLDADAGTGITDAGGKALDGEWPVAPAAVPSFPSGDGTPGGDFRFRMNVLPGDVNRNGSVSALDLNLVKMAQGAAPGSSLYAAYKDVNGTGSIVASDVSLVRARQGTTLPAGTPTVPTDPELAGGSPTLATKPLTQSSSTPRKRLADGLV